MLCQNCGRSGKSSPIVSPRESSPLLTRESNGAVEGLQRVAMRMVCMAS